MNEKRFSLEYCDNMSYVKDNFNDNEYYLYWAVELMNELYEENEQLRKENVFLAKQRNYWKSKCAEWMGVKEENLSLRCVNMSEKRFECVFVEDDFGGTYRRLKDNETGIVHMTCDVVDLLNFQNTQIKCLKEENEKLRKELDSFKLVMFQDMRKGTIRLYAKGGIDE